MCAAWKDGNYSRENEEAGAGCAVGNGKAKLPARRSSLAGLEGWQEARRSGAQTWAGSGCYPGGAAPARCSPVANPGVGGGGVPLTCFPFCRNSLPGFGAKREVCQGRDEQGLVGKETRFTEASEGPGLSARWHQS